MHVCTNTSCIWEWSHELQVNWHCKWKDSISHVQTYHCFICPNTVLTSSQTVLYILPHPLIPATTYPKNHIYIYISLTLVLLNPAFANSVDPNQSGSALFVIACKFVSTTWIKQFDCLEIRSGQSILIYSAWQVLKSFQGERFLAIAPREITFVTFCVCFTAH